MKEHIRLDYNNMMADYIGTEGITDQELEAIQDKAAAAYQ